MINKAPDDRPITLNISLGDESASELEKAEAIRDVMQHAATMSQAVLLAKEMKSWPIRPVTLAVVGAAALALCAFTFVAESDWAFGPDPARLSAVRRDGYTRFAMFLAAQRVAAYQDSAGVLPSSLAETGEDWDGVVYDPAESTFVIHARSASGEPIVLLPNTDLKVFLGDSRRQLRERRP